ncbi:glycosyltransferase family 39 protein [Nocardioides anomalus]|uniref:Glycosyltransferase family 39 protein n=1 Tax=Nocardioides anomalus TaxID=2712223 RepID=A0A6G6WEM4_9ACTN|nr:glycosyltransferase family 39 protein [Nocardioides anomalus]QIG43656.1 glycosyltransferase family 39 protein [Nocardioides anomalus]
MLRDRARQERALFLGMLVCAGLVFGWDLDVSGYANSYYSAAAQAGAESWKAMLFGSLDQANAITVDKPPLALWPMSLSVRAFGMSSWSLLVPQALEGVGSVALLYACVRRATGAAAPALLAGLVFTVTPVAALVFRYNNPDALLTLLLVGAAWAVLRAVDSPRATWWLLLAGALCGLGFLTKMLEAFVVLPALTLTYLRHGAGTVGARLWRLTGAGAAVLVSAGWWVALVELWPTGRRPFVGGSPTNSVLELALGYNGLGRLTGSTTNTESSATGGGLAATNLARIGRTDLGGEVMWLVPAAIILGALAWKVSRREPALRGIRPGLLLWTSWAAVGTTTFAAMAGIFHSYYTVVLAPALAAVLGTGTWLAWQRRDDVLVRRRLCWSVLATALLAAGTLAVVGADLAWVALPVVAVGVVVATLLHPASGAVRVTSPLAAAALVSALAGPVLFTEETVRLPHVGSGPMAGPGRAAPTTALLAAGASPFPGLTGYQPLAPGVVATVARDSDRFTWAAAAMGARSAAAYELALDEPVLAIGGYKGSDPLPTLHRFQALVAAGQVHWLIPGGTAGAAAEEIQRWVAARFAPVVVDGRLLYDVAAGQIAGQGA